MQRNLIQTHSLSSSGGSCLFFNSPSPINSYYIYTTPTKTNPHRHQRNRPNKMIKSTFLPNRIQSLPVSQPDPQPLRRRLSSSSSSSSTSASSSVYTWTLQRSKSVSAMGENAGSSIKKWWEMGWGWILSKKPGFARDLELNEHEKYFVGKHNKGTWMHVFYKVRAEFRRILGFDNEGLPLSFNHHHQSKSFY